MARLFISAERLDAWAAEGCAAISGEQMTLVELGRVFAITPAVHFIGVTGNDADPAGLVGLVKDTAALAAMGADHMATSVIYGDTAYVVQNGFLGEPLPS